MVQASVGGEVGKEAETAEGSWRWLRDGIDTGLSESRARKLRRGRRDDDTVERTETGTGRRLKGEASVYLYVCNLAPAVIGVSRGPCYGLGRGVGVSRRETWT